MMGGCKTNWKLIRFYRLVRERLLFFPFHFYQCWRLKVCMNSRLLAGLHDTLEQNNGRVKYLFWQLHDTFTTCVCLCAHDNIGSLVDLWYNLIWCCRCWYVPRLPANISIWLLTRHKHGKILHYSHVYVRKQSHDDAAGCRCWLNAINSRFVKQLWASPNKDILGK